MKDNIGSMFVLSQVNQHVWRITKIDNPNKVWNFVRREEAESRCDELNELYASAYVDGHADACSEFSAMLNARPEQEVA
jgi:hypothetical protein